MTYQSHFRVLIDFSLEVAKSIIAFDDHGGRGEAASVLTVICVGCAVFIPTRQFVVNDWQNEALKRFHPAQAYSRRGTCTPNSTAPVASVAAATNNKHGLSVGNGTEAVSEPKPTTEEGAFIVDAAQLTVTHTSSFRGGDIHTLYKKPLFSGAHTVGFAFSRKQQGSLLELGSQVVSPLSLSVPIVRFRSERCKRRPI